MLIAVPTRRGMEPAAPAGVRRAAATAADGTIEFVLLHSI